MPLTSGIGRESIGIAGTSLSPSRRTPSNVSARRWSWRIREGDRHPDCELREEVSMARRVKVKAKARTAVKKSAGKKVVKLKAKKAAVKAGAANGLPRPSAKPWGQAGKALDGVRILDFTHVQSGPTCTQLLAYMGADVIKDGDVLVENFAPGALDRMGLTWEHIHKTNPRMIVASVKGFGPGPYEDCKVYENVAQCAGGAASTTGFREGPPLVTGAQIGDSGTGLHLAFGIVSALYQRTRTGRGQRVLCAMQDGVLNLARVKLRDQQRLAHGALTEYSQYGEGVPFGKAVPRAGNDSGGGQPGWILKCKGWESDPDSYIYFITQAPVWGAICDLIGKPEWKTDSDYA